MSEKKLYALWAKLGVVFPVTSHCRETVDIERTIIETARKGKNEPNLLLGMRTWIIRHHNLISGSRLIGLIKQEKETSVLGVVLNSVIGAQPRSHLKNTRSYCHSAGRLKLVSSRKRHSLEQEKGEALTLRDTGYIFKHNFNLALRALWGPSVRTEIICYFLDHHHEESNARQITQEVAYSYEPVHSELTHLVSIGFLERQRTKICNANLYRFSRNLRPDFFIASVIALSNNLSK